MSEYDAAMSPSCSIELAGCWMLVSLTTAWPQIKACVRTEFVGDDGDQYIQSCTQDVEKHLSSSLMSLTPIFSEFSQQGPPFMLSLL